MLVGPYFYAKSDQTNAFAESLFGPKVNDKLEKLGTVTKLRENRN